MFMGGVSVISQHEFYDNLYVRVGGIHHANKTCILHCKCYNLGTLHLFSFFCPPKVVSNP